MTNEEILEGNKLIAEFMGLETITLKVDNNGEGICIKKPMATTQIPVKYHESWDWLMPVVIKIEETGYIFHMISKNIYIPAIGYIHYGDVYNTKIEVLYESVVYFIKDQNKILSQRTKN